MKTRTVLIVFACVLAVALPSALGGCAPSRDDSSNGGKPDDGAVNGSRLAPGLYDLPDGTVQAVGTLVWRDLEGGFWAIVGGDQGATVAVIANGSEIEKDLRPLEGKSVVAVGTRFEGASIRMAGPEIIVSSIEQVGEGGAAE